VLRDNGAIQDGATGFVVGDVVYVMKKITDAPGLADTKVVGHVGGTRHCTNVTGLGYFVFYLDDAITGTNKVRVAKCKFMPNEVTMLKSRRGIDLQVTNMDIPDKSFLNNPLTWNIKKFRHNILRNGTRVESDLYYIFTSLYMSPYAYTGWVNFCNDNPSFPLVFNNLNTEMAMTTKLMEDLQAVNYSVNHAHTYVPDPSGHDTWSILMPGQSGDCEDFALTKAQALLQMGYPASALHIECSNIDPITPPNPNEVRIGHAWLVAQTDVGDYALDINSDTVVLNSTLTFSGREFFMRRRQIGQNWAYISPFSPVSVGLNAYLGVHFSYIFDPLLNILYPLPMDSFNRPFLYPNRIIPDAWLPPEHGMAEWDDNPGDTSINFSEDNNYIYFATCPDVGVQGVDGNLYTFRLDENVLTEVNKTTYTGGGYVWRDGTIHSLQPSDPIDPAMEGLIQLPWWWWVEVAEVISPDGHYDFQYQWFNWFQGLPTTIQH
jgi:predicted transglutaminase-like cysteine proteinase